MHLNCPHEFKFSKSPHKHNVQYFLLSKLFFIYLQIEIFVTDVRGQTHTFQVNPNTETVYQLRQRLGRVDSCRYLTFEGRTLQDNQVLANYRVRHHCTLLERGRVQGGSNWKVQGESNWMVQGGSNRIVLGGSNWIVFWSNLSPAW